MATAKKTAPKATATSKMKPAAKAVKPVIKAAPKKAPASKTAKAIAKITASIAKLAERKDKLGADIQALRDQRTVLKATVAPAAAPVGAKGKISNKAAAPVKKTAKKVVKK